MPTIYVTAPPDAAGPLAETLVENRLAACVNLVDCRSIYRWEDAVRDEPETIMLVKTSAEGVEALEERLLAEHPHEVPCIERFDESDSLPSFARWRDGAVGGS